MIKAKKSFGQHFLRDPFRAEQIAQALPEDHHLALVEIGPGQGALTRFLWSRFPGMKMVEIDPRMVNILIRDLHIPAERILQQDILHCHWHSFYEGSFWVCGNFPYNISTQIVFGILEYRDIVEGMVGMFQKEVAKRITSPPGGREYGIQSVMVHFYYESFYLFELAPMEFDPPPKVHSAVIKLVKRPRPLFDFEYKKMLRLVKLAFNQRRKKLSNALSSLGLEKDEKISALWHLRAENLSGEDFFYLYTKIEEKGAALPEVDVPDA